MLNSDIIRAENNEENLESLNSVGMIEMSDADMESFAGGGSGICGDRKPMDDYEYYYDYFNPEVNVAVVNNNTNNNTLINQF